MSGLYNLSGEQSEQDKSTISLEQTVALLMEATRVYVCLTTDFYFPTGWIVSHK